MRALLLIPAVLCFSLSASPQATPVAAQKDSISNAAQMHPAAAGYRFPNGQTFQYKGEWRIFDAGVATLRMDAAGGQQRIVGTADSTGFVAKLFRVHDVFESFFDAGSFCSLQLTKHVEEGSRIREINLRFDNAAKKSILDQKVPSTGQTKHLENDTPGCVTDVVSGIFYIGSLKLEPGMSYVFPMNDGGKTLDVRLQVEGRESIKTDAGTFNTVRVKPEGGTGKANVLIWYSDDAAHIPVRLRSKAFWGTLTMTLKGIDRAPATASGSAR